MPGIAAQGSGGGVFDDAAGMPHCDLVRDVPYHGQIVGDEEDLPTNPTIAVVAVVGAFGVVICWHLGILAWRSVLCR